MAREIPAQVDPPPDDGFLERLHLALLVADLRHLGTDDWSVAGQRVGGGGMTHEASSARATIR